MKKSVVKNYLYNVLYQVFLVIVPLVLTPYVARVLGPDGSGQYSFAASVMTYFAIFAAWGFRYYAQRQVAVFQGDKENQSVVFWELFIVKIFTSVATLLIYFVLYFCGVFSEKYELLMLILSIDILSIAVDISYFFQGLEEFGAIVLRNILVKLSSIALVLLLVKKPSDLWIYAVIMVGATFISNIILWVQMPKYLVKVKISRLNPLKHLKPSFVLFVPTIAISIYTSLDKTMIGLITKVDSENGNYEYAEKIVKVVMTLITSLGTVMIPRNSKKIADGDIEGVKNNISLSMRFAFLLGIPLTFGMIAVADNMVPWFLGTGYDKAALLIKVLSPLILIIGLSNVLGVQLFIPMKEDKKFTLSITIGAAINFALNLVLIYFFDSIGAAASTVIAEAVITFIMLYLARNNINFKQAFSPLWKYILSGTAMFIPCVYLGQYLAPSIINSMIIAIVGVIIYAVMILLFKDDFVKMFFNFVKRFKSSKKGD